ncbi:MAG: hypothetical protein E1N59_1758 [Puniceicoccaceae bacterium 5H]|nr:MAG: hypothetical protein E1N59_1758 [Puniceicoccaceae bacterium 5H]
MKNSLYYLIGSTLGLTLAPASIFAAQGDSEFSLGGAYQTMELEVDDVDGNADLNGNTYLAHYGYFVLDKLALGVEGTYRRLHAEVDDEADATFSTFSAALTADYYLPSAGSFSPYLGASLGYLRADLDANEYGYGLDGNVDGLQLGARVGVQQFLADNVALNYQVCYNYVMFGDEYGAEDLTGKGFSFALSLSYFFGE